MPAVMLSLAEPSPLPPATWAGARPRRGRSRQGRQRGGPRSCSPYPTSTQPSWPACRKWLKKARRKPHSVSATAVPALLLLRRCPWHSRPRPGATPVQAAIPGLAALPGAVTGAGTAAAAGGVCLGAEQRAGASSTFCGPQHILLPHRLPAQQPRAGAPAPETTGGSPAVPQQSGLVPVAVWMPLSAARRARRRKGARLLWRGLRPQPSPTPGRCLVGGPAPVPSTRCQRPISRPGCAASIGGFETRGRARQPRALPVARATRAAAASVIRDVPAMQKHFP